MTSSRPATATGRCPHASEQYRLSADCAYLHDACEDSIAMAHAKLSSLCHCPPAAQKQAGRDLAEGIPMSYAGLDSSSSLSAIGWRTPNAPQRSGIAG